MKYRGVCLRTVEEQREGGDEDPIDPHTVEIPTYIPVRANFREPVIGAAALELWDGRLWAVTSDLSEPLPPGHSFAIGFIRGPNGKVVIYEVFAADKPSDHGSIPYEVIDQPDERSCPDGV